jgi:hypothetical protein
VEVVSGGGVINSVSVVVVVRRSSVGTGDNGVRSCSNLVGEAAVVRQEPRTTALTTLLHSPEPHPALLSPAMAIIKLQFCYCRFEGQWHPAHNDLGE